MKLLFAHVLIVIVTVVLGVTTLPLLQSASSPKVSKQGLADDVRRLNYQISDRPREIISGEYMLDSHFRSEFFNLNSVYIPADENEFRNREFETASIQEEGAWPLKSLVVTNDSIAFQTTEFAGESFAFVGVFRPHVGCGSPVFLPGMNGTVSKLQDGVLVATATASFYLRNSIC